MKLFINHENNNIILTNPIVFSFLNGKYPFIIDIIDIIMISIEIVL